MVKSLPVDFLKDLEDLDEEVDDVCFVHLLIIV